MPGFVSPANIQWTPLQSQIFASGASVSIQTAGALPTGRQVRRVLFILDIDITQPGAGMAAQLGIAMYMLIAQIKIARRVSITGLGLHFLNWLQKGMEPESPAGFAAGAAADVRSRRICWSLDYYDETSQKPGDACIPSELWTDPIEVRFGTNAIFAATIPTLGNGLLRTYVEHEAASVASNGKRVTVPPSVNIQSDDFNALSAFINKPGAWVYVGIYREPTPYDGGAITSANISNLIASVDGIPLMNSVRAQDLCSFYNQVRAAAPNPQWEGQSDDTAGTSNVTTAPAHLPGSAIHDQPAVAAAAGQGVTMNFVPVLFPGRNYKVSQLPRAKVGLRVDSTGTLGAYKMFYRLVERRPDQGVGNAARRLGITNGGFGAKTQPSPISDDPELAPFLPATVVEK